MIIFPYLAVLFVPVDSRIPSCNIYLMSHQKTPPYFNLLLIKTEILNKIFLVLPSKLNSFIPLCFFHIFCTAFKWIILPPSL